MKILIVSENTEVSTKISQFIQSYGQDAICYRNLIKALDNVEEINPDLIILSAQDYPRHWKTFIQYIHGIGLTGQVILYSEKNLNDDEVKKSKELKISGYIKNLDDEMDKYVLKNALKVKNEKIETISQPVSVPVSEPVSEPVSQPVSEPVDTESIKFVFTNPKTGEFVNGTVIEYNKPKLIFEAYDKDEVNSLRFGQIISNCTLKCNGQISSVRAQIQSKNDKIEFCILP